MKGEKKAASSCSVKSLFYTIQKKQSSVVKELQQWPRLLFGRRRILQPLVCFNSTYSLFSYQDENKDKDENQTFCSFLYVLKKHIIICNVILRSSQSSSRTNENFNLAIFVSSLGELIKYLRIYESWRDKMLFRCVFLPLWEPPEEKRYNP